MNVCCHDWPFSSKLLCVTLWHSKQIYDVCGRHMYMAFCEESSRRWNCVFVPKAKPIKLMGCRITDGTFLAMHMHVIHKYQCDPEKILKLRIKGRQFGDCFIASYNIVISSNWP